MLVVLRLDAWACLSTVQASGRLFLVAGLSHLCILLGLRRRRRREWLNDLHLLHEAKHVVEEYAVHPVHVRLRGETVPAVMVWPLLGLSLDHHDQLLAMPVLPGR